MNLSCQYSEVATADERTNEENQLQSGSEAAPTRTTPARLEEYTYNITVHNTKQELLDQADDHFRISQDSVTRALLYHLKPLQRLFGKQQVELDEMKNENEDVKEEQLDPIALAQLAQRVKLRQLSMRLDALDALQSQTKAKER
jgi:hypothetical protein